MIHPISTTVIIVKINPTELYVAFVSRGIPYGLSFLRTLAMHPEPVAFNSVRLVDFPKSAASTAGPATALANWMKNYFDGKLAFGATEVSEEPENATKLLMGASPVIISDRLPVILQVLTFRKRHDRHLHILTQLPAQRALPYGHWLRNEPFQVDRFAGIRSFKKDPSFYSRGSASSTQVRPSFDT
jgi:hypothetical protein